MGFVVFFSTSIYQIKCTPRRYLSTLYFKCSIPKTLIKIKHTFLLNIAQFQCFFFHPLAIRDFGVLQQKNIVRIWKMWLEYSVYLSILISAIVEFKIPEFLRSTYKSRADWRYLNLFLFFVQLHQFLNKIANVSDSCKCIFVHIKVCYKFLSVSEHFSNKIF